MDGKWQLAFSSIILFGMYPYILSFHGLLLKIIFFKYDMNILLFDYVVEFLN